MANQTQILDDVGQAQVIIKEAGITKFSHTFPLAQINGFKREIEKEHPMHRLITLDISNSEIEEVPFNRKFWNTWEIIFPPLGLTEAQAVINCMNACTDNREIYLIPRPGFPQQRVNNITDMFELRRTFDKYYGTIGLKLVFRNRFSQSTIVYNVPPVDPAVGVPGIAARPTFELGPG